MLIPVHPGIGNRYIRIILHDVMFFAKKVIGYVGHTGRVTGNHLHLEVRIDGNRADVLRYFTL